jgi:hypothetical protein
MHNSPLPKTSFWYKEQNKYEEKVCVERVLSKIMMKILDKMTCSKGEFRQSKNTSEKPKAGFDKM